MANHDGRWALAIGRAILVTLLPASGGTSTAQAPPHPVSLLLYLKLDQVETNPNGASHGKVGDIDRIRLTYDPRALDPTTRHVPLSGFQHLMGGPQGPPRPDPSPVPVDDSWLDLSHTPYRLHFKASVVHGEPIVIEADESTRRLTIHRPDDPTAILLAGPYWIDGSPERSPHRR